MISINITLYSSLTQSDLQTVLADPERDIDRRAYKEERDDTVVKFSSSLKEESKR